MTSSLVSFNDTWALHPLFFVVSIIFTTIGFVFLFAVGIKFILLFARGSKKPKLAVFLLSLLFGFLMLSFLSPLACTVTKIEINEHQDWILKNQLNIPIGVIASSTPRSLTVQKALGIMTNPESGGRGKRTSYIMLIKTKDKSYQSISSISTPLLYGNERILREQAAKQNVSTQVSSEAYNFNTIVAYSRYVLFVLLVIVGLIFMKKNK